MKRQPPYYELDHEKRRLVETVVEMAEDLARVQHSLDARNSMLEVTQEVAARLGLSITPPEFEPEARAEVVPLRPFRVIERTTEDD